MSEGLSGHILMTGGTGFLGRAILRRAIADKWDASFTVYSRDVMKQAVLRTRFSDELDLNLVVGDVRDYDQLERAISGHDVVLHLAALKHIPQAEINVTECVEVNVQGSRNVLNAAIRNGVGQVVGISTDKATAPLNAYGLTKTLMEKLFQEAQRDAGGRFTLARYGNVVGSTGSVIPFWAKQAADTGRVSLTEPTMTRFWLDCDDAVNIVLGAAGAPGGAIYIPKMPAMRLVDMASAMHPDAPQDVIGLRPGEKLHESLLAPDESWWAEDKEEYYLLHDPTKGAVNDKPLPGYSSDAPSRWLSAREFRNMVEIGEQI